MNFFQQQEQAHKQSRRLLVLFILAVVAIVAAVNGAAVLLWGVAQEKVGVDSIGQSFWQVNGSLLIMTSLATLGLITIGSAWKSGQLRQQGSRIAEALGGTRVPANPGEFQLQRLRNVVEEVSLASGVPVPSIYVIEGETGINAFAAGFNTDDAAVAVTRGCLEALNREELQGVIAHEFSHILNGDMRLNLRLMGWLHGILLIALAGEVFMRSGFFGGARVSRNRDNGGGGIVLFGLALFAIGYIGVFFARWIKAAVSRQREYLADASAVQFTRYPAGISGALQKIAVHSQHSYMDKPRAEQISHMLFASGLNGRLLATHPPLEKRIQAIEPAWKPSQLEAVRQQLISDAANNLDSGQKQGNTAQPTGGINSAEAVGVSALHGGAVSGVNQEPVDDHTLGNTHEWVNAIGAPSASALKYARMLRSRLPSDLLALAHDSLAAQWLMFALLATDDQHGAKRLKRLPANMQVKQAEQHWELLMALSKYQRLPLLEVVLATLKELGADHRARLITMAESLARADQTVTLFEFSAVARIATELSEEATRTSPMMGKRRLFACRDSVAVLFATLARLDENEVGKQQVRCQAGLRQLFGQRAPEVPALGQHWSGVLKRALFALDELRAADKQILLEAILSFAAEDGKITLGESEILRLVAYQLHVPLPPLATQLDS
jgi:Zn-dependent protease with chaperone function/uncharacterized tellurite resistance protein B-like protein